VNTDYPNKESETDSNGLREWSDNNVEAITIINISKANKISVRFEGKHTYDFNMTKSQLKAFKEIVAKCERL